MVQRTGNALGNAQRYFALTQYDSNEGIGIRGRTRMLLVDLNERRRNGRNTANRVWTLWGNGRTSALGTHTHGVVREGVSHWSLWLVRKNSAEIETQNIQMRPKWPAIPDSLDLPIHPLPALRQNL